MSGSVMMTESTSIFDRNQQVQARISVACDRAKRAREDVQLVAVSKNHPPEAVEEAADAGLHLFGENRVQEAAQKIPACRSNLTWHLIGHLQTNKVKLAVPLFDMIHSVDSLRLLQAVNDASAAAGRTLQVLIQVNTAGERSKFGLAPDELEPLLECATKCLNIDVMGLMTIPPIAEDPEKVRPFFAATRELRDRVRASTGFALDELSMGMSHDLEVAIEEGATFVRVGTDLFGKRII
ncbi:MAG: pyridoxal phosphate enzyme (YggS family) [Kiritimatiellia bacterium]|jgi:pyridoxal phosphate enzyme (YggS family)